MKKMPTFILAVREALHNEALKQEKKILDWKLVLDIVKETCKQEISVEVNDKQVYLICTYLSIYGLVR